jgi:hypothetical protein
LPLISDQNPDDTRNLKKNAFRQQLQNGQSVVKVISVVQGQKGGSLLQKKIASER